MGAAQSGGPWCHTCDAACGRTISAPVIGQADASEHELLASSMKQCEALLPPDALKPGGNDASTRASPTDTQEEDWPTPTAGRLEGELAPAEGSGGKEPTTPPAAAAPGRPDAENPFDDLDPEAVLPEALQRVAPLLELKDYNMLAAEEIFAQAIASLEGRRGSADAAEAKLATVSLEALRSSEQFKVVNERVAQFDSATEILYNENMQTLFECDYGRFDLCVSPDGRWFDYRMTVDIDAPLSEALSTGHEMDYVPQAQPLVHQAEFIGEHSGFNLKFIMRMAVLIFKSELVIEIVRHRDTRFGYLLEVARTEFPHEGAGIPKKAWGAIRPWIYTTNFWMPRGGGQTGCTIVQVTRVDCTMSVPAWVLNFVFKKMSTTFIEDLRSSAIKALQPESPWAQKIKEDKHGFYRELRKIEEVAGTRHEVSAKTVPKKDVFDRPWRLYPELLDTRPPCSR